MDDITYKRKPIFLGPNTMLCLTVFNSEGGFDDLWMYEHIDPMTDTRVAAKSLVDNLSDLLSVSLIWELREALAEEIHKHNSEFGTSFSVDRPPSESR